MTRHPSSARPLADDAGRLRVLLVITRLENGGAQRVVLHTARGLDRTAFAPGLAWGPGDVLDDAADRIEDLERMPQARLVRPVAPRRDLGAVADLRRAIRSFGADVVHTHSSKAGILGRLAARLERVPAVVHTIHGWGFTPLQPLPVRAMFYAAERLAARWTDGFIAVSSANRKRGLELGLLQPGTCRVIRAAVELDRFRTAADDGTARRRLAVDPAVPLVVQVGNFKPQKAPLDFVRMAAAVAAAVPGARFVMVGDGPQRADAERLVETLGLGDRFRFPGWWDDVPALLATATVSVLTSRHEGLPCAVVESLAAGVPVVAAAVDGTPEVVHDDVNGALVAPGDVTGFARAVTAVLTDPDRRRRLAAAAPGGLEDFEVARMVEQQEDLYRCLSGCSRSPSPMPS